jgi:hypothetical protein
MSSLALVPHTATIPGPRAPESLPPVPWRDVHDVAPTELTTYIATLERLALEYPRSADVRTALGMAHAVNCDVYKSLDALEDARRVEPDNFWAQFKFAELHYRLRALNTAEEETRRAADLASNPVQLAIARRQMKEIRALKHTSVRNVEWTKSLTMPTVVLSVMIAVMFAVMMWK